MPELMDDMYLANRNLSYQKRVKAYADFEKYPAGKPITDLLGTFLQKVDFANSTNLGDLGHALKKIVGEKIFKDILIEKFSEGLLTIDVYTQANYSELVQHKKNTILSELKTSLPKIGLKDIRFKRSHKKNENAQAMQDKTMNRPENLDFMHDMIRKFPMQFKWLKQDAYWIVNEKGMKAKFADEHEKFKEDLLVISNLKKVYCITLPNGMIAKAPCKVENSYENYIPLEN